MIKAFLISVQFLTRLPVRLADQPSDKALGQSLLFYPLVGCLLGSILIGLAWLLSGSPPLVTAALLVTLWVLLTGGLHLDGLADSADAWIGGMGDRAKTLAIMKDPNCGPAGVVAIALILLLKFAVLHSLVIANEWITVILATTLARTLLLLLFLTTPYVRSNGLGAALATHQPREWSLAVVVATFAAILLLTGSHYFVLPLTAVITFLLLRHRMLDRIVGTTGDTAGALVEITETAVLLASVVVLNKFL